MDRLPPRSEACPLSLREILSALAESRLVVPLIRAPAAFVAHAALVAAKQARSVVGLAFASSAGPERWFSSVVAAANEVASGLPIFLSAEVVVPSGSQRDLERAFQHACRWLDAGMTHLAVDVTALPVPEQGPALAHVAQLALERETGLEWVLPPTTDAETAEVLLENLEACHVVPDLASLRGPPPEGDPRVVLQRWAGLCAALGGMPFLCRGPVSPDLAARLSGAQVRVCDDGGVTANAAARALSAQSVKQPAPKGKGGLDPAVVTLEYASGSLAPEVADRVEAMAFFEVQGLIERIGATGSADLVRDVLLRRFEEH